MFHSPAHLSSTAAQINIPHHATTPDFEYVNHGSIVILTPKTAAAKAWCDESLPCDTGRFGYGYAIETRCFGNILDGIDEAGLEV